MNWLTALRSRFDAWLLRRAALAHALAHARDQLALDRKLLRDRQRLQRQTLIPYGRAKVEQDDRSSIARFGRESGR